MVLVTSYEVPQPAPANPKVVILAPGGGESINKIFTICGTSICTGRVKVRVLSGMTVIFDPPPFMVDASGYWELPVDLSGQPDNTPISIEAFCDGDATSGQSRSGISITTSPVITSTAGLATAVTTTPPVRFSVTFTNHSGADQSVTTVIHAILTPVGTGTAKYEHLFSSNPPKNYTITIPYPDPGIYIAKITFIDGHEDVSTRTYVQRV